MRPILCILILSLSIPHAAAQSAVLIGLHLEASDDDSEIHPLAYRTFLITFRDGKAQLAADLPDLIVPRRDGFWQVGSLHKGPACCGGYQEFVYAAPVRSVPHAAGEYHPENPDWNCSETHQATIEFVNPDFVSVSYFTEPACSLQVDLQHATYKLDDLNKELDITAILGPGAWNAAKKAHARAIVADDRSECPVISKPDSTRWGIERSSRLPRSHAKPWVLLSDYTTPHVCGGGNTYEIDFPIAESLTGPTYHASDLMQLLQSKMAKDNSILPGEAVLTPAGDFLVDLDALTVYGIKQQALEAKPALSVLVPSSPDSGFNIVMVQWALGKHVREWEAELQSLQKTHLPEPVVATGSPQ